MDALLREVLQFAAQENVEVRAVCDTWRQQREKAAALVREASGREPKVGQGGTSQHDDLPGLKPISAPSDRRKILALGMRKTTSGNRVGRSRATSRSFYAQLSLRRSLAFNVL